MMRDALGQDLEGGVEAFIAGFHHRQIFDQRLDQEVLHLVKTPVRDGLRACSKQGGWLGNLKKRGWPFPCAVVEYPGICTTKTVATYAKSARVSNFNTWT